MRFLSNKLKLMNCVTYNEVKDGLVAALNCVICRKIIFFEYFLLWTNTHNRT